MNRTPASPGFGPAGFHLLASGPDWAGALRLQFCPQTLITDRSVESPPAAH